MTFPDEEAKAFGEGNEPEEKLEVLYELGLIAQKKYDEYVVQGGNAKGYNLAALKGSLQFKSNSQTYENEYWLEDSGGDEHWTKVAKYFEYGTGLYNTTRAGKYRAGYIKPQFAEYMKFTVKGGDTVFSKKVKGVHPIFAMEKAKKYVEFNRVKLERQIRRKMVQEYGWEEEDDE